MAAAAPVPVRRGSGQGDLARTLSSSSAVPASTVSALHNMKLLTALRSGNPAEVQPFLDALKTSPNDCSPGRILGMAVQVASVPILELVLKSPNVPDPNAPVAPGTTATALHVASEIGRADAVPILLNDPRIDDTLRDEKGRTPLECAANEEVASLIETSRAQLQARYMGLLSAYVASSLSSAEESSSIAALLAEPRSEAINLNALDERTGTSLLHEAARRRDLRLVELAVKKGADVFVRDRRGRRVLEHDKSADERIKAYLRQFSNQDSSIAPKSDGRPPDLKGFLSKWVNYRQGWKTRWFVLENGVLSYYRNREDEHVACRGSIALATAYLHPSIDGNRFEVSSAVTTSVPKIIVKSSARGEIARWVQAIRLNMEFYQNGSKIIPHHSREASTGGKRRTPSIRSTSGATAALGSQLNELPADGGFLHPGLKRTATGLSGVSVNTQVARQPSQTFRQVSSPISTMRGDPRVGHTSVSDAASMSEGDSGDDKLGGDQIPHESEFELSMRDLNAQLEATEHLVGSIVTPPSSSQNSPDPSGRYGGVAARQNEVKAALRDSLATITRLVQRQHIMTQDREKYYENRIKREVNARKLWEENVFAVAQQQAETEHQLNEAAKDNEKKRRALRQARGVLAELASQPTSPMVEGSDGLVQSPSHLDADFTPALPPALLQQTLRSSISRGSLSHQSISRQSMSRRSISMSKSRQSLSIYDVDKVVAAMDESEDDDDEFFDAIETNTIPNLKLYDSIANPQRPSTPTLPPPVPAKDNDTKAADDGKPENEHTIAKYLARDSLQPYDHVRHRLPIDDDKRPSVSLWSILKSSIGKDLTRITFPVSFNECTSMLQRMAEDMEYDACLTVAAGESDSLKRIAFVAAFAMSNYSSTIGRIAKPFNPMLSQSFEYAIPNRYRYISEQVSHHPPISACYCEAPTWKYYGEVDAKNKFQGRYFEIRPTGVAHAELMIPKSWTKAGTKYPDAGPEYPEGYVTEHYSWKKVITNVSNFIMGNPIIDHYGDLTVTNHRTGETCTLTFKPRTWRGKDAFEIKGSVYDTGGDAQWEIAGRWDSQLIARRVGIASEPLESNEEVDDEDTTEYMQLWRNTTKPKAPFNLTPYAMTLNDIPKGLEAYLAPTDCRLRTDMRAFENADYEHAQALKSANEDFQRATRKMRAEGKLPPHEPRWFDPVTDADSGERLWEPKRADDGEVLFWHEREEQGALTPDKKWAEVDQIFTDVV